MPAHALSLAKGLWAAPFFSLAAARTTPARSERIIMLVVTTMILGLGDLYMTLVYALNIGMMEVNPLARTVMNAHPVEVLVLWKVATMGLFGVALIIARRTLLAELAAWLCVVVMALLTMHWLTYSTNVSTYTNEFAALALCDDPRWVALTGDHGEQIARLARATRVSLNR